MEIMYLKNCVNLLFFLGKKSKVEN